MHCWQECKLVQSLWKTVLSFLNKLKIELPEDPTIPLPGIYLKKTKTLTQKDIRIPMFTAALCTVAKIWKQPKCPWMDEQVKKIVYILCSYKKEWNFAIHDNMNGGLRALC